VIIYIDIDNTICDTIGLNYHQAQPRVDIIEKINTMYNDGAYVVMWTSRGVGTGICHRDLTIKQLTRWGLKYHELRLDKPVFDLMIDDKAATNFDSIIKEA
jgi:histidinol phosphatase-like enzyme